MATAFIISLVAGVLLIPHIIRFGVAYELYDQPDGERRIHTTPVPRLGGVAVYLAAILGVAALIGARVDGLAVDWFLGALAGGSLLFLVGLVDDVRGLTPRFKLAMQGVAALVAYSCGFRIDLVQPAPELLFDLSWLALPVTVLWIVGTTNAFNLIDGLDGLAGGLALVALAAIFVTAALSGLPLVMGVAAVLIGAILAFLRFNFHPARVFLGDGGSLFLGFFLSILAVEAARSGGTTVYPVLPVAILAIPLLDTSVAIARRWLRGTPIFGADGRHLHHQLLRLGLSQRRVALVLWQVAAGFALLGIVLLFQTPSATRLLEALGIALVSLVCLYGIRRLDYHEITLAGLVLRTGARRAQRAIRDNIKAHDLAAQIRNAKSIKDLNGILAEHAERFHVLSIQVSGSPVCERAAPRCGEGSRMHGWRLHFPLCQANPDFVLEILGGSFGDNQASLARLLPVIVPSVEQWLRQRYAMEGPTRAPASWKEDTAFSNADLRPAVA